MNTTPITPVTMSGVTLTELHNISVAAATAIKMPTMKSVVSFG